MGSLQLWQSLLTLEFFVVLGNMTASATFKAGIFKRSQSLAKWPAITAIRVFWKRRESNVESSAMAFHSMTQTSINRAFPSSLARLFTLEVLIACWLWLQLELLNGLSEWPAALESQIQYQGRSYFPSLWVIWIQEKTELGARVCLNCKTHT